MKTFTEGWKAKDSDATPSDLPLSRQGLFAALLFGQRAQNHCRPSLRFPTWKKWNRWSQCLHRCRIGAEFYQSKIMNPSVVQVPQPSAENNSLKPADLIRRMESGATWRSWKVHTIRYRTGWSHREEPWEARQGRINTGRQSDQGRLLRKKLRSMQPLGLELSKWAVFKSPRAYPKMPFSQAPPQ